MTAPIIAVAEPLGAASLASAPETAAAWPGGTS
jgi:hypothetical protein